LLYFIEEFGA
jgi:hypothetical protein